METLQNLDWLNIGYALGLVIGMPFVLGLVQRFMVARLERVATHLSENLNDLALLPKAFFESFNKWFFVAVGVMVATELFTLSPTVDQFITAAFVVLLFWQLAISVNACLELLLSEYKKRKEKKDPTLSGTLAALTSLAKFGVWVVAALLALDNLGFDVTTLLAGLGIGGIAVALAAQNILGDLFAALSIIIDRPFTVGDFIISGEYMGTVEKIGLKTTRIRSISGEQVVVSNTDLLSSRVRNYKRMRERRVLFALGVEYGTPAAKLAKIPTLVEAIINKHENSRFDRCHFKAYGDFSLNFEIVYFVESADYKVYMDLQQAINLEIYKKFEKEGIAFAFPTQTIHLVKQAA